MRVTRLIVGPISTNCYVVRVGDEVMVVDPGGDAGRIIGELDGAVPLYIINTHGHPDHVGANKTLAEVTGAPVLMHEDDVKLLGGTGIFGGIFDKPSEPDRFLENGDELELGDITFKVLHTPGHTPGGICLYTPGAVFVGDTLFAGSVGRTDLGGGDYNTLIDSIKNKLLSLPPDTKVLPGHGPESTIALERATNPFLGGL
ncbi:MAG: MBL fold metallo-hydrolase [Candidatus Coatesbacteria bacterium]|nr:MAG: MBL fold metallo-hydrolase [Candidatus Coatesbacteria bacterium]